MRCKKILFLVYTLVFSTIYIQLNITNGTCWFHHYSEDGFSEVYTLIFHFLTIISSIYLFYKSKNKYYLIFTLISLALFLEESNYGQNFFSGLTYHELEDERVQFSLHTWKNNKPSFIDDHLVILDFKYQLAEIFVFIIIPLFITYCRKFSLMLFMPLIFLFGKYIIQGTKIKPLGLFIPSIESYKPCLTGSGGELTELLIAGTLTFYVMYLIYDKE